jgi:hypothetical protein
MNSFIRSKTISLSFLSALVLACFGVLPRAQAQLSPTPDGGYPGENTAEGDGALFSLTGGIDNTAVGFHALNMNTYGFYNTAIGGNALAFDTTGFSNTAIGAYALEFNTTGNGNTATGVQALLTNTLGNDNTATGVNALFFNTTGNSNTATGVNALSYNNTGHHNTATGFGALEYSTLGNDNTATGVNAIAFNTTGSFNTANGRNALFINSTGSSNVADGFQALYANTAGNFNTADGYFALNQNTSGSSNIALGNGAGGNLTTGDNNIDIGNSGVGGESRTIRIGTTGIHTATYIAGIIGKTLPTSVPVFITTNGQLGTSTSSARFKDNIKPMDKASEAILALKPVTFRYKKELDRDGIPQFGLVAEDVEKVNPDLVMRDADGKVYTVRYDAVNAMLLNEFLKEHRKVEQLKNDFESKIAQQQKQIEALTAGLQKVSAQVEMSRSAPQVVNNNQ